MPAVTKTESFWKKVSIGMLTFAITLAGMVGFNEYERRQQEQKPAATFSGKFLIISAESKDQLVAFMKKEKSIVAVSAISISLVANRRQPTFFESENPEFQKTWETFESSRTSLPPVFSKDQKLNSRVTSIINGNFECHPTKDTIIATLYDASKFAPVVCSISVPAGFDDSGDFVGYLNFFLTSEISDGEKARLAKEAVLLSTAIYNRDIAHSQAK